MPGAPAGPGGPGGPMTTYGVVVSGVVSLSWGAGVTGGI